VDGEAVVVAAGEGEPTLHAGAQATTGTNAFFYRRKYFVICR
jgi:hypothetical protein